MSLSAGTVRMTVDTPSTNCAGGGVSVAQGYLALPATHLGAENDVCVVEHALLQRHNDELRLWKVRADHAADVLRVAQIQRGIHLIQDVDWRRL